MKEHRRTKRNIRCHSLVATTGKWTELLCLPVSFMPRFLEAARSTAKDCNKEMERSLIPFISLHEMIVQTCGLRENRKTKDPPYSGLIHKQNIHYSEKWLQMECLGSKHYTQNYSYLPFITVSKLLTSGAVLPVSPEMHPEISRHRRDIFFPFDTAGFFYVIFFFFYLYLSRDLFSLTFHSWGLFFPCKK